MDSSAHYLDTREKHVSVQPRGTRDSTANRVVVMGHNHVEMVDRWRTMRVSTHTRIDLSAGAFGFGCFRVPLADFFGLMRARSRICKRDSQHFR